jgi:UDP-glucose 4-epimerase
VLVTGAAGYLGGRLVGALAGAGVSVRASARSWSPSLEPADDVVLLDLLGDEAVVSRACDGIDTVVHLAGPNETAADPDAVLADTVVAGRRVAAAATAAGVRRIVYVSTVHVYGAAMAPGAVLSEGTVPEPRSPYAIARLAVEHLVGGSGCEAVIVRLTNGVGAPATPGVDRWSLVANDLCRQAVLEGSLRLRSSGMQWRDFVALEDVCRVLTACAEGTAVPPGTYLLGSGSPVTVRHLADLVAQAVEAHGEHRPAVHAPPPEGDPPEPWRVDVGRLAALGLGATVPLSSAVDETVRFCLRHRRALGAAIAGEAVG